MSKSSNDPPTTKKMIALTLHFEAKNTKFSGFFDFIFFLIVEEHQPSVRRQKPKNKQKNSKEKRMTFASHELKEEL